VLLTLTGERANDALVTNEPMAHSGVIGLWGSSVENAGEAGDRERSGERSDRGGEYANACGIWPPRW